MNTTKANTLLLLSLLDGDVGFVRVLLENGADVSASDADGLTPLVFVVSLYGNADVARVLLGNGADVNASDSNGRTSLMRALEGGRADIA